MKLQMLQPLVLVIIAICASISEAQPDCITSFKLEVATGDVAYAEFTSGKHIMVLKLQDMELESDILPPAPRAQPYVREMDLAVDFHSTGCVRRSDILQIRMQAGGPDGWYIVGVRTLIKDGTGQYTELTNNPGINQWLDGNDKADYSYNATVLVLSLPSVCITSLDLIAITGDEQDAESSSDHKLVLLLDNQELQSSITGPRPRGSSYFQEMSMYDFGAGNLCLQKSDIKQVRIEAGGDDGWEIAAIKTVIKTSVNTAINFEAVSYVTVLTNNPAFNLWVDGNQKYDYTYDAKKLLLTLV